MSIIDNLHCLDINIFNRDVTIINKKIKLYNTDKNIVILSVRLIKDSNKPSREDMNGLSATLTVVKPKTNQLRELTGVLRNNSPYAIYDFKLPSEFIDQVGTYICEITLNNGEETITFDSFEYIVKASAVTGLNAEIESNPDLPVLKQLIEEVKNLQTSGLTTEQVTALDNIFKKWASTTDATTEYQAFKDAFGISN